MPQRVKSGLAAVACALAAVTAAASGGAWRSTRHGDPDAGVQRLASEPRGECAQCHDQHASRAGAPTGGPFPYLLFAANDNALCATCHDGPGRFDVYPGTAPWSASTHAVSPIVVWPGPEPEGRPAADAGKCVNCHDAHGNRDADGIVPSMLAVREEGLCLGCHDGQPAPDVRTPFLRAFRHPVGQGGRHDAGEGGDPARFAGAFRHAECADCHNPHRGSRDQVPPAPPAASNRLLGVSRVKVTNGPAATRPVYTWAGPAETGFAAEYEVCFKCHSSWTTQPVGQSDLALLLNPNNPSFHPVVQTGRNRNIDPLAFANGWTWDRLVYCSDCHGSDDPSVRGPHGSSYRHLLRKDYAATSTATPMAPTDLCFDCHSWDTYANDRAADASLAASRFNPPAEARGHAYHVGRREMSCYACHQSHGSTQRPALIATGRAPGLAGYTQTATGGSCTPTCHRTVSYAVNYLR
jgi:predicted CXXCH cytochrome family protein